MVPTLVEAVRTNDALCQQRALLTFYHVTKVLASKRLMHDRKLFEEVKEDVLMRIVQFYRPALHNEILFSVYSAVQITSSLFFG